MIRLATMAVGGGRQKGGGGGKERQGSWRLRGLTWPHFFIASAMTQAAITIGSKVRVTRVRDRIPADLVAALQADATGTVTDFKVTDGKGIGVVVTLANGATTWFFDDEITAA
jgi:hypothetical protein